MLKLKLRIEPCLNASLGTIPNKRYNIAALKRLKFNAFKALEGGNSRCQQHSQGYKMLNNYLEKNGVFPIHMLKLMPTFVNRICQENDLVLAHEGPSETKDTKIAALRLKFNAFKALEGEKVNATFYESGTTRFFIHASSSKALISNTQLQDSDSDVEEDTRSSSEFLADLNVEFHDRALLANQKRYYKRSRRVGSAKKPNDKTKETCFACGKLSLFQKDCLSTRTSTPSYPSSIKSYSKPKFQSNSTP
ncbi:hypothetical protein Tco_0333521 [Tanacetum coccineum]